MRELLTTLLLFFSFSGVASTAEKPNILFIIADDLGYGDLACYGNPVIDTPHLDQLAASGVRLTQHYAPSPLCAPSRAAFLTGRYPHRTGAVDVPSNRGLDRIALSEKTFGDYFRGAGYATALIGKWHNGLYCNDYLPHRRGFDLFFGFPNGGQDYWKWNLLRNDQAVPHDGRYLTDALNDETIQFIREAKSKDQPFAIFLAHHTPHVPFQAPDELIEKYRKKLGPQGSESVARIYAMIEAMDIGLGQVFATLKEEGLRDDTVIVFTSDNGAHLGNAEGHSAKRFHAGLSGNKGDVGEQGIRVPGIVSWPGKIPPAVIDTPVHGCDWLPSLFGLTGESAPQRAKKLDGTNVMALLKSGGKKTKGERSFPFQKNRYHPVALSDGAIRQGNWKLVYEPVAVTMKKDSARDNASYFRGLVHPHWEMPLDRQLGMIPAIEARAPRLYDLSTDPGEKKDLAVENPGVVKKLAPKYINWFHEVIMDWHKARAEIIDHDRDYWKDRKAPDPNDLFQDHWLWNRLPVKVDTKTTDPTTVFRGYWSEGN